jgi:hypothetical protein
MGTNDLLIRRRMLMQSAKEQGIDYSQKYFTVTNVSDDAEIISLYTTFKTNIKYRLNGGSWITSNFDQNGYLDIDNFKVGDYLEFSNVGTFSEEGKYTQFDFGFCNGGLMDVSGNILSLIYGDDFKNHTTLPSDYSYAFSNMFENANNVDLDASNLILPSNVTPWCYTQMFGGSNVIAAPKLPAMVLAERCYSSMFAGCHKLTTAPDLLATTLVTRCYYYMFRNCIELNYVKAMFTTTPARDYTGLWLYGVSANGTFVKNKDATWNVTSSNGIPSGWTVLTE